MTVDSGVYCAAARMAQYYDQLAMQVGGGILNTSKLMLIKHVARHAYHKQFSYAHVKNLLGNYTGISAADHNSIWMLAVDGGIFPHRLVAPFDILFVAFRKPFDQIHGKLPSPIQLLSKSDLPALSFSHPYFLQQPGSEICLFIDRADSSAGLFYTVERDVIVCDQDLSLSVDGMEFFMTFQL